MSARLGPSVGQIKMDDQRLNVLATMNGSSECLTVNFETISKSLAGIKSFFSCFTSCFTGQSFKDQINLNTIADTLDPLFNAQNITNFREDVRTFQSEEKEAAKLKIRNIARNLTLIADRKGRTNPHDPGALRLRAIVSRLGQEFDLTGNAKSSSDFDNDYVLVGQSLNSSGGDFTVNDGHSSPDHRYQLLSQNDEDSGEHLSFDSSSDNGSVNFSEEGSSPESLSSGTVTPLPSPTSQQGSPNPLQGSPILTKRERRHLAKQNEQKNLASVREAEFARMAQIEAAEKAAKKRAKREAALKQRKALGEFAQGQVIELRAFIGGLEKHAADPDEMNRALVLRQDTHKKRCEKFISDHVEKFKGATRENICIAFMKSLEEAIQQKQLLAEATGAVGVATNNISGKVALVQAAHLQLLKDYVNTLRNPQ